MIVAVLLCRNMFTTLMRLQESESHKSDGNVPELQSVHYKLPSFCHWETEKLSLAAAAPFCAKKNPTCFFSSTSTREPSSSSQITATGSIFLPEQCSRTRSFQETCGSSTTEASWEKNKKHLEETQRLFSFSSPMNYRSLFLSVFIFLLRTFGSSWRNVLLLQTIAAKSELLIVSLLSIKHVNMSPLSVLWSLGKELLSTDTDSLFQIIDCSRQL